MVLGIMNVPRENGPENYVLFCLINKCFQYIYKLKLKKNEIMATKEFIYFLIFLTLKLLI